MRPYSYYQLFTRMQLSRLNQENIVFRSIQVSTKKVLTPLLRYSPEKNEKTCPSEMAKLRSSTSCESYKPIYHPPHHRRKVSINKSTNVHSMLEPLEKDFIPSQAKEFLEMVKKKHKLLKIKHKIKNENDCIPNILEIKESVKESQVSFLRRMDIKLNAGHANLLANLKKELHIKSHNYLREMNERNKKNRRYLKREETANDEQYVTIHYRLPTKERYAVD